MEQESLQRTRDVVISDKEVGLMEEFHFHDENSNGFRKHLGKFWTAVRFIPSILNFTRIRDLQLAEYHLRKGGELKPGLNVLQDGDKIRLSSIEIEVMKAFYLWKDRLEEYPSWGKMQMLLSVVNFAPSLINPLRLRKLLKAEECVREGLILSNGINLIGEHYDGIVWTREAKIIKYITWVIIGQAILVYSPHLTEMLRITKGFKLNEVTYWILSSVFIYTLIYGILEQFEQNLYRLRRASSNLEFPLSRDYW